MSTVVHIQTQISVTFGVLDGDDAPPQEPITATLGKFSPEAFAEAYAGIAAERDKLAARLNAAENGNREQRRAAARTKPAAS